MIGGEAWRLAERNELFDAQIGQDGQMPEQAGQGMQKTNWSSGRAEGLCRRTKSIIVERVRLVWRDPSICISE
jgi:hypothetical protein